MGANQFVEAGPEHPLLLLVLQLKLQFTGGFALFVILLEGGHGGDQRLTGGLLLCGGAVDGGDQRFPIRFGLVGCMVAAALLPFSEYGLAAIAGLFQCGDTLLLGLQPARCFFQQGLQGRPGQLLALEGLLQFVLCALQPCLTTNRRLLPMDRTLLCRGEGDADAAE